MLLLYSQSAYCSESKEWYFEAGGSLSLSSYEDSLSKSKQNSGKLLLNIYHLDKTRLRFTSGISRFSFHNTSAKSSQNINGGTVKQNFYTDTLSGKIGIEAGFIRVSSKDIIDNNSYNAGVDYLNYQKTIYSSYGFTRSNYGKQETRFNISQHNIGFGATPYFNNLWLHLSAIAINSIEKKKYHSIQTSLTLYPRLNGRLFPKSLTAGAIFGEQQYAVDMTNWLVYNSDDIKEQEIFLSALWQPYDRFFISITGGQENFRDNTKHQFALNYISSTFIFSW